MHIYLRFSAGRVELDEWHVDLKARIIDEHRKIARSYASLDDFQSLDGRQVRNHDLRLVPPISISLASSISLPRRRATRTTSKPSRASRRAKIRPIPEEAPVTRARGRGVSREDEAIAKTSKCCRSAVRGVERSGQIVLRHRAASSYAQAEPDNKRRRPRHDLAVAVSFPHAPLLRSASATERRHCANTGRSPTARRTGQIDPL